MHFNVQTTQPMVTLQGRTLLKEGKTTPPQGRSKGKAQQRAFLRAAEHSSLQSTGGIGQGSECRQNRDCLGESVYKMLVGVLYTLTRGRIQTPLELEQLKILAWREKHNQDSRTGTHTHRQGLEQTVSELPYCAESSGTV
ncbi:unnamed protein product [Natator depressus]